MPTSLWSCAGFAESPSSLSYEVWSGWCPATAKNARNDAYTLPQAAEALQFRPPPRDKSSSWHVHLSRAPSLVLWLAAVIELRLEVGPLSRCGLETGQRLATRLRRYLDL